MGDIITIQEKSSNSWWYGECNGRFGYFPTNYVLIMNDNTVDELVASERIQVTNKQLVEVNADPDKNQDSDYFQGYSGLGLKDNKVAKTTKQRIHHEMLSDDVRTAAYKKAIETLRPYIEGKIVMDVGCGTGVLSIFAAKAGAKHVYAIEASEMANQTRKIVRDNHLTGLISIVKGKLETIFLPVENVDVIVSEWMGVSIFVFFFFFTFTCYFLYVVYYCID
ncbi:protein arginine methyltransferase [Reticulomyxa filosa]|uniref:Protein arginine methyltransferase n=1 Tax=Reticulomyxa filosa TaxID=46433 RepID=X6N6Z8_RETFI|nr:protein arginine methyltransferase [Reticulomyxa filosa]|eukprot:ETO21519.1 protein arginine methyltransferase [Reticulomyxa filosa]